jgi:hypothetical protein
MSQIWLILLRLRPCLLLGEFFKVQSWNHTLPNTLPSSVPTWRDLLTFTCRLFPDL